MKIYILFFFLLPIVASAQTKKDYEHAMAKFQKFYNAGQGDSINAMFGWDEITTKPLWTNEINTSQLNELGELKSFQFIGIDNLDPDKVYVFETVFSKAGKKTTSLTLDKNKKIGDFRLVTTSEGITALLKNRKK